MSSRPRRAAPSSLNNAVISHVTGVKPVDQARAEAILTKFISTSEAIATSSASEAIAFSKIGLSNTSGNNPILGQLKRVQRDLRGLPPLLAELDSPKRPADESAEEPKNKKIKFSDENDLDSAEAKSAGDESSDETAEGSEKPDEKLSGEESEKEDEVADAAENVEEKQEEEEQESSGEEEKRERKRQKKLAKKEKKEKKKQLSN
ncbi:hypothetical protein METBIDRAFT_11634 [Metschnikowia bicuspidata var. bicuspidata NRRL YB-4993]|uniref:Uncharacterized protein n=1 Tax=Metschnikowia bicuspidata var. bicuspidata NRRL YB-4993 TaxID=869754 RepID=A0A1A0HA93_9ASCO|nr:hypothetical protein METBIDRAFT_11634 [Metschnikowia bicuspidata var. bicuspidata NRRL YB-4993]OBA21049.1 hypothetical protein METBIDRAFT_11634 [Metschnikowia bicuspidata var. bicuspidata NRRL YB-4993]